MVSSKKAAVLKIVFSFCFQAETGFRNYQIGRTSPEMGKNESVSTRPAGMGCRRDQLPGVGNSAADQIQIRAVPRPGWQMCATVPCLEPHPSADFQTAISKDVTITTCWSLSAECETRGSWWLLGDDVHSGKIINMLKICSLLVSQSFQSSTPYAKTAYWKMQRERRRPLLQLPTTPPPDELQQYIMFKVVSLEKKWQNLELVQSKSWDQKVFEQPPVPNRSQPPPRKVVQRLRGQSKFREFLKRKFVVIWSQFHDNMNTGRLGEQRWVDVNFGWFQESKKRMNPSQPRIVRYILRHVATVLLPVWYLPRQLCLTPQRLRPPWQCLTRPWMEMLLLCQKSWSTHYLKPMFPLCCGPLPLKKSLLQKSKVNSKNQNTVYIPCLYSVYGCCVFVY